MTSCAGHRRLQGQPLRSIVQVISVISTSQVIFKGKTNVKAKVGKHIHVCIPVCYTSKFRGTSPSVNSNHFSSLWKRAINCHACFSPLYLHILLMTLTFSFLYDGAAVLFKLFRSRNPTLSQGRYMVQTSGYQCHWMDQFHRMSKQTKRGPYKGYDYR